MSWPTNPRLASSLIVLRDEVNAAWPARRKTSDGTIGDPAHFSRGKQSDHNPWVVGPDGVPVVRAIDLTHDPAGGLNCDKVAERVRVLGESGDPRLGVGAYVIWDRRKASAANKFKWRAYGGVNPHTKHLHLSVTTAPAGYDIPTPWGVNPVNPVPPLEELLQMELSDKITIPASYPSNLRKDGQPDVVTVEAMLRRIYDWAYRGAFGTGG